MKMKKIVVVLLLLCLYATAALSESVSADEEGNAELEQGNIFNIDALTVGGLSKIGEQNTNESFLTTDFERVIEGRTYSGWRFKDTPMILINSCIFDQDKNFITLLDMPLGNNIITIPQGLGACYMRCSIDAVNGTAERMPRIVPGENNIPWSAYKNGDSVAGQKAASQSTEMPVRAETCYAYLPDVIYCAVGTTIDLYNNQVCINADRFHMQWICPKGFAERRRFTITADTVEDLPLTLNIYDNDNIKVWTKSAVIRCVAPLTSGTLRVLPIGDSMTYGGATWQMEIQRVLSGGAIQFVGTQKTSFRDAEYRHEGYNGITAYDFLHSEKPRDIVNPFYNPDTEGFDYGYYLNKTGIKPDAVMISLGTNDMNGATVDEAGDRAENIVELVRRVKSASPDTPVYVCNAIYRSNQDGIAHQLNSQGYSASIGKYKYAEDMKILNLMIALSEKLEAEAFTDVYTVPLALCHDSEYNFGKQTIKLNSRSQIDVVIPADSIHPNKSGEDPKTYGYDVIGYLQFADVMFSVISGTQNSP